jgi:hypothetical protein
MLRKALAFIAAAAALGSTTAASASSDLFVGFSDDSVKYEPGLALGVANDLGAKAFRFTLRWQKGETDLTSDEIAQLDRITAAAPGIRLVVALYGKTNRDAPTNARSREQYCTYAKNLLARYPTINDIVIWNETNKQFFWYPQYRKDGSDAAPAAYVALLARCWDVLHAFKPDVNLLAAATSPRGNDRPAARSNVSHSPIAFIRAMGVAYRAMGLTHRIFDTVAHHGYGPVSAERPFKRHRSTTVSQGDLATLVKAFREVFADTAQPVPGKCAIDGWCVRVWYTEMGYQTRIDATKKSLYTGVETDPDPIPPDDAIAGPNPESARVSQNSLAPDQATQIADSIRLAYCQPYVAAYFNLQLWDEPDLGRWQSAPLWVDRTPKQSYPTFKTVLAEVNSHSVDCRAVARRMG